LGGVIVIWLAGAGSLLVLVLVVVGLLDLVRYRHKMEGWQFVLWALAIVFLPIIGLVAYLFWRLSRSQDMQDAIEFQDEYSTKKPLFPTSE
jgi:NADH:ubiquinone oxidoreductase subunit 6 (subunit J)